MTPPISQKTVVISGMRTHLTLSRHDAAVSDYEIVKIAPCRCQGNEFGPRALAGALPEAVGSRQKLPEDGCLLPVTGCMILRVIAASEVRVCRCAIWLLRGGHCEK